MIFPLNIHSGCFILWLLSGQLIWQLFCKLLLVRILYYRAHVRWNRLVCVFGRGVWRGVRCVCGREKTACVSGFRHIIIVLIVEVQFKDLRMSVLQQWKWLKMGLAESCVFPERLVNMLYVRREGWRVRSSLCMFLQHCCRVVCETASQEKPDDKNIPFSTVVVTSKLNIFKTCSAASTYGSLALTSQRMLSYSILQWLPFPT